MPIRGYRELLVWQRGMKIATGTLRLCRQMCSSDRRDFGLQLRRASISIPANIAEGYGRDSRGDYIRFRKIANGSLKELETLLQLYGTLEQRRNAPLECILDDCDQLGRMLNTLIRRLALGPERSSWRTPKA